MVGPIEVLFVVFLCSGLRSSLSPLQCLRLFVYHYDVSLIR